MFRRCTVSRPRALWAMLASTLLFWWIMSSVVVGAPHDELDAVVVLGHRPPRDANGIEYETRARVERGVELFLAGAAPRLMFSGGGRTPDAVEADIMAEHAITLGVSRQDVLRESESRDTIENARLSVALLRGQLSREPRILLVTSNYHMGRAATLFRCAGAVVTPAPVVLQLPLASRMARRAREALVRVAYWLTGACARAKPRK